MALLILSVVQYVLCRSINLSVTLKKVELYYILPWYYIAILCKIAVATMNASVFHTCNLIPTTKIKKRFHTPKGL